MPEFSPVPPSAIAADGSDALIVKPWEMSRLAILSGTAGSSLKLHAGLGLGTVALLHGLVPWYWLAMWSGFLGASVWLIVRQLSHYPYTDSEPLQQTNIERRLTLAFIMLGLIWALGAVGFTPLAQDMRQYLLCASVVSAATIGVFALNSHYRLLVFYLASLALPILLASAFANGPQLVVGVATLTSILLIVGWRSHQSLNETLYLIEENDRLACHHPQSPNWYRANVDSATNDTQRQTANQQFIDFAQLGADILWETDANLRFCYVFGHHQELLGYDAEQMLGQSRLDLICRQFLDTETFQQHVSTLTAHEEFADLTFKIDTGDAEPTILSSAGKPIFNAVGQFMGYRGVEKNVTDAHCLAQQLRYQATHDVLTDLKNRREIERLISRTIERAKQDHSEHALCYLDLDQFKVVNDTCGHSAGDELLRQLANLFRTQIRNRDSLARLGGDEFCLLLEHCSLVQAQSVANKLRAAINEYKFENDGRVFHVGASIGVICINEDTHSLEQLMSEADGACYAAKESGRNRVYLHNAGDPMLLRRHDEMEWVSKITKALANNNFTLFAQPISPIAPIIPGRDSVQLLCVSDLPPVDPKMDTTQCRHFEVLVRMIGDDGETIAPGLFLPAAENYNLSPKLDRWVIRETFRLLKAAPHRLHTLEACSINLSGNSLGDDEFPQFVMNELQLSLIPAEKICFEITETAAISHLKAATRFITALSELGCQFALDDFGSGLSSFGYLKNLPVNYLKIDGQFIRDIETDPIDLAMVKSINEVGQVLGKKTIAEFVENDQVLAKLREMGVNYAQGYGIGKPVPIEQLIDEIRPAKTSLFLASPPQTSSQTTTVGQIPVQRLRH